MIIKTNYNEMKVSKFSSKTLLLTSQENKHQNESDISKTNSKETKKNSKRKQKQFSNDYDDFEDIQEDFYQKKDEDNDTNEEEDLTNSNIVMNGRLIYRYTNDQIELDGFWTVEGDQNKDRISYLLLKNQDKISIPIKKEEINFNGLLNDERANVFLQDNSIFYLNLCSANIFEVMLIPNSNLFRHILKYISGEYHGFFLYYEKTIEDRFYINFILDEGQIRLTGNFFVVYIIF